MTLLEFAETLEVALLGRERKGPLGKDCCLL